MSGELSTRIKSLRKINGYTQKEFADLLGVVQTTVANYENGIRIPDAEKLSKIASLLHITVDYLLGTDERPLSKKEDNARFMDFKSLHEVWEVFLGLLLKGDREGAGRLINTLHEDEFNIRDLYFEVLAKVMSEVGVLWEKGIIDVWKEHYISETVLDIMRELKAREIKSRNMPYSVLALTSGPELHNIGLKMITDLLELEGCIVTYLGSNVPVQSVIKAIEITKPNLITLSVTMPYHIEAVCNTIAALKNHFRKKAPKIMVGGGAFTNLRDICSETGADYYGASLEDVISALEKEGSS